LLLTRTFAPTDQETHQIQAGSKGTRRIHDRTWAVCYGL